MTRDRLFLPDNIYTDTVTIANAGTTSTAIDCRSCTIVGIIIPSAFTGTSLTFTASDDNSTFRDLYNSHGAQYYCVVAVDRHIALELSDFMCARYFKLVSGSTEGAERTITVVLRSNV